MAEVFVTIPGRCHATDHLSHWAEVQLHGATCPVSLESPSLHRDGNLHALQMS